MGGDDEGIESERTPAVGLLWRDESATGGASKMAGRMAPVLESFTTLGASARPVLYAEEDEAAVRDVLLQLDAVLVWVDPVSGDRDRVQLDALLREVAAVGPLVSAHPDVIAAMGTKDVLVRTQDVGWCSDIHRYAGPAEMAAALPDQLARGPRVLKPVRGNGGIGIWKVEALADGRVRVQEARLRDTTTEDLNLDVFVARLAADLDGGPVVDQPFERRVAEGMVRCYFVADELVGFARQTHERATGPVFGIPAAKTMYDASEPAFARLRARLVEDWIRAMQRGLGLTRDSLPVLWDADFLFGHPTDAGEDTYVLCEINVSSVAPFPPEAVPALARETLTRIAR